MKKRLLWFVLLSSLCTPVVLPAQEAADKSEAKEEATEPSLAFKWANFGILAIGLGFLLVKSAPAFFNARTDEIQKAIKDATGLKIEADFRASEVDRKLATLGAEVEKLRVESQNEMAAEKVRLQKETELAIARINQHVTQEVASLRQNASNELRCHVADLAASMASSRLRDHLSVDEQSQLIRSFVGRVREGTI